TTRNYTSEKWQALQASVKENGVRNGYLMAIAPNSSTAMIAGSTASIDPIFQVFYYEEKKDFKIPVTAPELDHNTYDIYRRSAYIVDQRWSVRQMRQDSVILTKVFHLICTYQIQSVLLFY